MTGVGNFPALSRSDAMSENSLSRTHRPTSPSDCVEHRSRQDEESKKAPESDSDSGDSLFITQQPVPEAERSRSHRGYKRPHLFSPTHLEESEDEASSSASDEQPRTDKKKKSCLRKVPRYGFSFLTEIGRKSSSLTHVQNQNFHNFTMGGFFKCVKALWPQYQHPQQPEALSLPTVDTDGESISPLSEEEENDEDIKVVEKKCFLASSKAKRKQTWGEPSIQQIGRRKTTKTRPEPSTGTQVKTIRRAAVLSSHTKTSDDPGSSCGVSVETEKNDEEEPCNDSTISRSPRIQRRQRQYTQNSKEASTSGTEPQSDLHNAEDLSHTGQPEDEPESLLNLINDTVDDSVCSKRDESKKSDEADQVEEAKSRSEEEPEGLHAAASVNVDEGQSLILCEDNGAELLPSQTGDTLEVNDRNSLESSSHDETILRQEEGDVSHSEQKKKKKKKKSEEEELRQEVNGDSGSAERTEESMLSPSCNVDNSGKKKKKKKREKSGENEEDVELCQPGTADKHVNDDAQIQMRKKRRKEKERVVVTDECEDDEESKRTFDFLQKEESENTAAFQETSESKRKKHKKKRHLSSNDATQDGEEGVNVSISNDAVGLEENVGMSSIKKKKKKKAGPEGWTMPDDNVAQSDDSVSVRKKEKKRTSSFLIADAEEKDTQPHGGEQNSPPQPVDAHVWAAGDFQTQSAEITGDSVESIGVRKKKKKKKRKIMQDGLDRDHQQDFEEANGTCQNSLPEGDGTGGKRKKKHKRNESEFLTPVEIQEAAPEAEHSQTDEPVVLKKKKKKKKCKDESDQVVQESPAAEDAESEQSTVNTCIPQKIKRKRGSTSDQAAEETLAEHASPSSETFHEARDKKKKKTKSTENTEIQESEQMEDGVLKKKHRKAKRRLHNPSVALLT